MEERSTIEGVVENVVFQNEDNGYTVLHLNCEGSYVTVVGCIPYAAPGEALTVTGMWVNHPAYGEQMTAELVERRLPEDEDGMEIYLASGIVKGVRAVTAAKIVGRFGRDSFYVIENETDRLMEIKGITAKRAGEIGNAFKEVMNTRFVMAFLARYNLPVYLALLLIKSYGNQTMRKLKDNPYILVEDRYGVDFSIADEIAISMGIDGNSSCRTEAALRYELSYNQNNGHVFLPREKLLAATNTLIDVGIDCVEAALDAMIERRVVVEDRIANVNGCYLRNMYEAEIYVTRRLHAMKNETWETGRSVKRIVDEIERKQGIAYAPSQREAVTIAASTGLLLLTGGPGTGKTTSVRGIVHLFERMGLNILLLAPTGRAAKRMSELCDKDAQTIHRALGMSYNEDTGEVVFKKTEKDPLDADAVIVDEMSMVDLLLMDALLRAMRPGTRLVMVGDPDQLPSVGAGNVLGDLVRSEMIPCVALKEVFRQAEASAIIRNAHAVNEGRIPDLDNKQNDFFFMRRRSPDRLVQTVTELCRERLPQNMHIPIDQIQVLSPMRKGDYGTTCLNQALQAVLNPPSRDKHEKVWGTITFREGDRVMQTRNNYDVIWQKDDGSIGTGIFNGDVGIIQEIDTSGELITIRFDDRTSVYTPDLLSEIDMAYAMTVHKAQGSEYKAVIFVAGPVAPSLKVRGVLYTAITRARELLVVVGDDVILQEMAENDKQQRRYSGLRRRLREFRVE